VKVLVTGAGGQLGHDLLDAFDDVDVLGLGSQDLDVSDREAVDRAIESFAPAAVINAAAWTDVDGCESDGRRAHAVNALGPWWLARACLRQGATLVSYSTDYVYDGHMPTAADGEGRGLTEFDPTAPINAYGRSKVAGEQLIRQTLDRHHIVRTAWVCGARGSNFVTTMLRLGGAHAEVRVVDDQVGSPTFTRHLAAATRRLLHSGHYGTINLTNSGSCSWYDLAAATFELSARHSVDLQRQPSWALQRPAPRPSWSVLDTTHAEGLGIGPLPHWREGLRELLAELGELDAPATQG
jgi:dTDP-4-dehydrorhamnose reductase